MTKERRKKRNRRKFPNRRTGRDLRATERRQRFGPVLVDQRGDDDQRNTERRGRSDRRTWAERRRPPA